MKRLGLCFPHMMKAEIVSVKCLTIIIFVVSNVEVTVGRV